MKEIKIEARIMMDHPKCNVCGKDAEILLPIEKQASINFCISCGQKVQVALQAAIDSIPF